MRKIIRTSPSKSRATALATLTALAGLACAGAAGFAESAFAATVAEPQPVTQTVSQPLQLAPNAPERHVVVPGDTLWGIASKFLKDPYRWNELFKQNKDTIHNPHLIYPGQTLVLDRSGAPSLRVETVKLQPREYVEALNKPLWTISQESIRPYLGKPLAVEPGALDAAARIVGLQDGRVIVGAGDRVFADNVGKAQPQWHVFRLGAEMKDPDTDKVLAHEALFLGNARQINEGKPAEFVLVTSAQEIGTGDYLLPAPPADVVTYAPRAPASQIRGRVIGLPNGMAFGGRNDVVSINRGRADGIEPGHVLALDLAGEEVDDRYKGRKQTYQLPDRRNGLLFVFRVFEHVAYGLVMEAERPVQRGATVRTP